MRIGFFDGEMTNLNADYGQLLCWCICEYDTKKPYYTNMRTFKLHDYKNARWDDSGLAKDIKEAMSEYDLVVSWNGRRFDIPFLNTRLEDAQLDTYKVNRHLDLLYTSRFKLKLSNNKLDTVSKYLKAPANKTFLDPVTWRRAMGGDKKSYEYIIKHCQIDVAILAHVYHRLRPMIDLKHT